MSIINAVINITEFRDSIAVLKEKIGIEKKLEDKDKRSTSSIDLKFQKNNQNSDTNVQTIPKSSLLSPEDKAKRENWIEAYNNDLPIFIGNDYILEKVNFDDFEKTLVFHYKVRTTGNNNFDFYNQNFVNSTKNSMKNHCKKMSDIFDYGIDKMGYYISDDKGKGRVITIDASECEN